MRASKPLIQFGKELQHLSFFNSINRIISHRKLSELVKSNGNRAFLVDTLAVVRGLEAQGIQSKHAEAITSAITNVLNDSLENVAGSFVSKSEMQKDQIIQESNLAKLKVEVHNYQLIQESNLSKFKAEVHNYQEQHFALLQRENEKLRSELRYEIDKVTAGQRLDLNLEKGRIRELLANQNTETTNLTNKLDREIHALRAQLEGAKYDVIKYCIGTLVSISAVGLAIIRIFM